MRKYCPYSQIAPYIIHHLSYPLAHSKELRDKLAIVAKCTFSNNGSMLARKALLCALLYFGSAPFSTVVAHKGSWRHSGGGFGLVSGVNSS